MNKAKEVVVRVAQAAGQREARVAGEYIEVPAGERAGGAARAAGRVYKLVRAMYERAMMRLCISRARQHLTGVQLRLLDRAAADRRRRGRLAAGLLLGDRGGSRP